MKKTTQIALIVLGLFLGLFFVITIIAINNSSEQSNVQTLFYAPGMFGKNIYELDYILGEPTFVDESTPPMYSHRTYELKGIRISTEYLYNDEKLTYFTFWFDDVTPANEKEAFELLGFESPTTKGIEWLDIKKWDPYNEYAWAVLGYENGIIDSLSIGQTDV